MVGIPSDVQSQLEVNQAALVKSLAQLYYRLPKNELVLIEIGYLLLLPLDNVEEVLRKEQPLS